MTPICSPGFPGRKSTVQIFSKMPPWALWSAGTSPSPMSGWKIAPSPPWCPILPPIPWDSEAAGSRSGTGLIPLRRPPSSMYRNSGIPANLRVEAIVSLGFPGETRAPVPVEKLQVCKKLKPIGMNNRLLSPWLLDERSGPPGPGRSDPAGRDEVYRCRKPADQPDAEPGELRSSTGD